MKKRGPIIAIIGVGLIISSFLIVNSTFSTFESSFGGQVYISNLLEEMFDYISEEIFIESGETGLFSYSTTSSQIPLVWGAQILDYKPGDKISITITNPFGDNFGEFDFDGPIIFEMFQISAVDIYNFEVANTGQRPIQVIMMFAEDPEGSGKFSDPKSPLMTIVIPLAISGIIIIVGIIAAIIGIIVTVMDRRKDSNKPRYI